jgi:hypothetical protein
MSDAVFPELTDRLTDSKVCAPRLVSPDLSEMLAIVSAIPDGISLTDFPSHSEGLECWCRPRVAFAIDMMIVSHKDLNQGDFDS